MYPSWRSDAVFCFLALLFAALTEQFVAYKVGLITGAFYEVLGEKDRDGFTRQVLYSLGLLVSITILKSARSYLARILGVIWRRHLTKAVHSVYFEGLRFYRLCNFHDSKVDNPDQRITSDIGSFSKLYSEIVVDVVISPILVIYYSYDAFTRASWIGPTGIYGLFLVSVTVNRLLMNPVVRATVNLEKQEGYFRFSHANIRSNSESLAFCGESASDFEKQVQDVKLKQVCGAQFNLFKSQLFLELATNGSSYIGSIASFLIISMPIFAGTYDDLSQPELSKTISENSFVCMYLGFQLSKLVDMSIQVSQLLGTSYRICEMLGELEASATINRPDPDGPEDNKELIDPSVVHVKDLSVLTPDESHTCLVDRLSLALKSGQDLLIQGSSSSGKTSLMRVLANLWPTFSGHFRFGVQPYFMPQIPYLCASDDDVTIRQQLTFPNSDPDLDRDEEMKDLIQSLGLRHLLEATEDNLDAAPSKGWIAKLSPGEKQTLAFLRLFYHKPSLAIMDEASSALSVDAEGRLYEKCKELEIQTISIGHRPTLEKYHNVVLTIGMDDGSWNLA